MTYNARVKQELIKDRLEAIKEEQEYGHVGFQEYVELSLEADRLRRLIHNDKGE